MKDFNAKTILSFSFPKKNNEVKIELVQLNPEQRIDIREWSKFEGETENKPTKKGISIPIENLPVLIKYLIEIQNSLKK